MHSHLSVLQLLYRSLLVQIVLLYPGKDILPIKEGAKVRGNADEVHVHVHV